LFRFRLDVPGTYYYWGTTTDRDVNFLAGEDAQRPERSSSTRRRTAVARSHFRYRHVDGYSRAGGPTVIAITACDLMTLLYIYAADSMRGREAGTPDAIRATAWIEREVRRLELRPAGDNGTYFQSMPVSVRAISSASIVSDRRILVDKPKPDSSFARCQQ
jgi:hypothetical protein